MHTFNKDRYERNLGIITPQEQESLFSKRACIVGCGGLGGYVASFLARFGVGNLTLIDGDVFSPSNLNRQYFSLEDNMGENKAEEGKLQIGRINSQINVTAVPTMLTEHNAEALLANHDIVVDCLDNLPARFLLQAYCEKLGITLVHGAIGGWYGQVANIYPGDRLLDKIYPNYTQLKTVDKELHSPTFTPALVASLQVSEVVKVLTNSPNAMRSSLLHIDLLYNDFTTIVL